ncbi:MAG: DUF3347 domain-containing protein [Deltaproteobacteria bacterium]|nr:DUF3347 domain-containing protein [Deltaproteobacteria bacterium]
MLAFRITTALAAAALLVTGAAAATSAAPAAPAGAVVDGYLDVHAALFADDLAAAQTAAKALAAKADAKAHADLARAAGAVAAAKDLDAARLAFGDASKALLTALAAAPGSGVGLHAFTCPMAKGYQKWVQRVDEVRNPYMGKRMPRCGSHAELTP